MCIHIRDHIWDSDYGWLWFLLGSPQSWGVRQHKCSIYSSVSRRGHRVRKGEPTDWNSMCIIVMHTCMYKYTHIRIHIKWRKVSLQSKIQICTHTRTRTHTHTHTGEERWRDRMCWFRRGPELGRVRLPMGGLIRASKRHNCGAVVISFAPKDGIIFAPDAKLARWMTMWTHFAGLLGTCLSLRDMYVITYACVINRQHKPAALNWFCIYIYIYIYIYI